MRFLGPSILAALLFAGSAAAAPTTSLRQQPVVVRAQPTPVAARNAIVQAVPELRDVTLTLAEDVRRTAGRARILRFRQSYQGIPILGRRASLTVQRDGTATSAASVVQRLPASVAPSLTSEQAIFVATKAARHDFSHPGRLVIIPTRERARLAWLFQDPFVAGNLPYAPRTAIDAQTGEVLFSYNTIVFADLAEVHVANPVVTPTPEVVTLSELAPGFNALAGDRVSAWNCIDNKTVIERSGVPTHMCDPQMTATPDASGDYLAYRYESDTAPEDQHAEVAAFYHVSQVYQAMTAIGVPEMETQPLPAIVNYRTDSPSNPGDPDEALVPMDNAFYSGGYQPGHASLWFGQGTRIDYAYDADVVYHEFGHAVVHRTADFQGLWQVDEFGAMPATGAMNEGLADYFSSIVAGDPDVGEYAEGGSGSLGAIRTLDNDDTCPGLGGESHLDSTFFSGALWSAREALPSEQHAFFDAAIIDTLLAVPSSDLTYGEFASLLLGTVTDSPDLGPDAADIVSQAITDRGILPICKRVVELARAVPFTGATFGQNQGTFIPSTYEVSLAGVEYVPSSLQYHLAFEAGALTVELRGLTVGIEDWPGAAAFAPGLLVHFGDSPITFDYANGIETDAELIELSDNWYKETVDVPEGATGVYFMLVNRGEQGGFSTEIVAEDTQPANTGGGGDGGESGSGGAAGNAGSAGSGGGDGGSKSHTGGNAGTGGSETEPKAAPPVGGDASGDDGCGCVVAGGKTGGATWWPALAGLLGLAWLRRRRR